MTHDPTTCPFCGDLTVNGNTGYYPEQFQVHTLAKLAELESRVQDIEWRNMPLGPGPDGNYGQGDLEKERVKRVADLLGMKEPECAACYDEEGSWACIRPAHAASLHLHEFVPPPHDDEQQCDADCRANWHKCKTCGKTRTELGLP